MGLHGAIAAALSTRSQETAIDDIDTDVGLSLEQRVWSQTGWNAATVGALATRHHTTVTAMMRFGRILEQCVRNQMGSHAAAAVTLSTTRQATAMATMRLGQGAARA